MTSVTIYKNQEYTSGFEMTFEVPTDYSGWPAVTHLFGFSDETSHKETVSIDSELI